MAISKFIRGSRLLMTQARFAMSTTSTQSKIHPTPKIDT